MSSKDGIETSIPGPEAPTSESRTKRKATTSDSVSGMPPKPKRQYPKKAQCWEHFIQREDDPSRCNCRYCGLEVGCDSKLSGTSPMKNHLGRCKLYKDFGDRQNQKLLSGDNAGDMKVVRCDPELFKRALNRLVVMNELSFSFVESVGWRRFCFDVLPMYKTFSRRTCARDIAAMYVAEKAALKGVFQARKQNVSLTTDIWVSPTTSYNYMVVTAHWVDEKWELQKRILSFKVITDHRGDTIAGQLINYLDEWGIEKVFSIIVDNASGNDKALKVFKDQLRVRGPQSIVADGEFLHMRCCAHILNLIVGDGLKKAKPSIVAIRNAFKFVRSSFARLKSFQLSCDTSKTITRGSLPLDCVTRWNSTYLMMTAAIKLRVPFERMRNEDKLYCAYFEEEDEKMKVKRVGPPTPVNWDEVQRLAKFLKIFYLCTLTFSASQTVSSTLAFNEIVNIERNLIAKCGSSDELEKAQARTMRDKFEKYWDGFGNMNPLVVVASVFDPRNKLQFVALCYDQLYGKGTIEAKQLNNSLLSVLKKMFAQYTIRLSKHYETESIGDIERDSSQWQHHVLDLAMLDDDDDDDGCERMDSIYSKMVNSGSSEDNSSELDIYLAERIETRSDAMLGLPYVFDVLSWWRNNSSKFPILSELARDVLAVQVSSVASESAFSTSGRVLDPYRSSLTPYMVEVLVCSQQWFKCNEKSEAKVANLVEQLEDVEFLESLDSEN